MNELAPQNQIIAYTAEELHLVVKVENETVWLTQMDMTKLFERNQSVISRHIANVFDENELDKKSNMHFLHITNIDRPIAYYSLDVIISVGYRVKPKRGTQFRIWANSVLKDYLLKGYVIHARVDNLERKCFEHDKQIAELVQTALPPKQGVYLFENALDRFLIIDGKKLYHIGASLKDLGKKWFGFSLIEDETILKEILKRV